MVWSIVPTNTLQMWLSRWDGWLSTVLTFTPLTSMRIKRGSTCYIWWVINTLKSSTTILQLAETKVYSSYILRREPVAKKSWPSKHFLLNKNLSLLSHFQWEKHFMMSFKLFRLNSSLWKLPKLYRCQKYQIKNVHNINGTPIIKKKWRPISDTSDYNKDSYKCK